MILALTTLSVLTAAMYLVLQARWLRPFPTRRAQGTDTPHVDSAEKRA